MQGLHLGRASQQELGLPEEKRIPVFVQRAVEVPGEVWSCEMIGVWLVILDRLSRENDQKEKGEE